MTYNFSSYPRMDPCISARTACITDPRYHHNFDPRCHNRFDPRHDGLDLNIQLPDFDLSIPPCPACPDTVCPPAPACPPCPSYPQPKPEPEIKPKTKEPEPFELGRLAILTPSGTDEILDVKTNKPTGLRSTECGEIIKNTKNDLGILGSKIVGKCYDNPECDKCVEALNSGIIRVLPKNEAFFSDYNMSIPEGTVDII
ncbi:hypothetical protein [Wolbachia endosymbiont (group A) of Ennomos erosarius]|uniref:hypothetical protein n=1 Tax=Wolbachia endosymbiont (group A) of Ennomos erosarius TaxID=3066174 RepID=UPI00333F1268